MTAPEHNNINSPRPRHRYPTSQLRQSTTGMSASELAEESEDTALLGDGTGHSRGESIRQEDRRPGAQGLVNAYHAVQAILCSSHANWLLGFVPLGMMAASMGWNSAAVFVLNFLAIFPLASLLSYSTEELSASVGQTLGGLINATFGNAVEMIVGITALRQGEIRIVQSSMVGSVLSGTLLILGCCFFFAGYRPEYRKDNIRFNVDVTGIMTSLMIVASASLFIPSALYSTTATSASGSSEVNEYILVLSHITSLILLLFYIIYLYFQLKSHVHLFKDCDDGESDDSHALGPWAASAVLIASTLGITVCSDAVVDSIDGVVEACNVSRAFIGLIIVPIVGNAGEFVTTVNAAMKDKLDLAIGLVVGSTLQIALFVTPFLVIMGWVMDQPMSLHFDTFETAVFSLAVVVVNCLVQNGQTNYFEGFLLIGTYIIIAIAFYVHPDVDALTM
ncbi:hypothetical protein VTN77DRAFT_6939 [Rasamsonia byssochlamydoides]|uniref:uncharacterized protein n=1 Tax=Rasamsonia byssochlamydoides TaxID=89139 RepID=UPI0037442E30